MRVSSRDHWRCNARPDWPWQDSALAASPLLLAQLSTGVPPQLLEQLRVAAPQLGLRQGAIAAAAIERLLAKCGF